jgi:hypothetical protein
VKREEVFTTETQRRKYNVAFISFPRVHGTKINPTLFEGKPERGDGTGLL